MKAFRPARAADRDGMRIVSSERGEMPEVILKNLYSTALQSSSEY